jgi:hypothetical protein
MKSAAIGRPIGALVDTRSTKAWATAPKQAPAAAISASTPSADRVRRVAKKIAGKK